MVRKTNEEPSKDKVYIEVNGIRTEIPAKEFGEDSLVWKNWKVLDVVRSERVRIKR